MNMAVPARDGQLQGQEVLGDLLLLCHTLSHVVVGYSMQRRCDGADPDGEEKAMGVLLRRYLLDKWEIMRTRELDDVIRHLHAIWRSGVFCSELCMLETVRDLAHVYCVRVNRMLRHGSDLTRCVEKVRDSFMRTLVRYYGRIGCVSVETHCPRWTAVLGVNCVYKSMTSTNTSY